MAMECLRHGAYGYVLKPFKTTDILIAVANALRRRMLELDFRDREAVLARLVREQRPPEARERGRMAMMPPTAVTLMDLAWSSRQHGSLPALLEAERGREIVPILPRLVERPEGVFTVYPWDAEYDALPGEGIPLARVPGHLGRLPSRLPAPRVQP